MTQPLRTYHFRIWIVLAPLLIALLIAGVYVRRSSTPINPAIHWEHYR